PSACTGLAEHLLPRRHGLIQSFPRAIQNCPPHTGLLGSLQASPAMMSRVYLIRGLGRCRRARPPRERTQPSARLANSVGLSHEQRHAVLDYHGSRPKQYDDSNGDRPNCTDCSTFSETDTNLLRVVCGFRTTACPS